MSKSKMIKTSKIGVYYNPLENGDKAFYFTYKNINNVDKNGKAKKEWVNVGKFSEGIREQNAFQIWKFRFPKVK